MHDIEYVFFRFSAKNCYLSIFSGLLSIWALLRQKQRLCCSWTSRDAKFFQIFMKDGTEYAEKNGIFFIEWYVFHKDTCKYNKYK